MGLAILGFAVLSLGAFLLRSASLGRPRSARVAQAGHSYLLTTALMEYGLWLFRPAARLAARLRVPPDLLSWGSLLFHLVAAWDLALGRFGPSAWFLLIGGACDSLDGTVARALGVASEAGEVLDAVIDRWAEMAALLGLAYHYREFWPGFLLSGLALAGSVMVSYTRAKAQAMGVASGGGLMQRHERAAYLIVAVGATSVLQWGYRPIEPDWAELPILVCLGLIGLLATASSLWRTASIRRQLKNR